MSTQHIAATFFIQLIEFRNIERQIHLSFVFNMFLYVGTCLQIRWLNVVTVTKAVTKKSIFQSNDILFMCAPNKCELNLLYCDV